MAIVELWLSLNDTAQHALSIPLDKCRELSVHPLKWLRFLGYSIYGRQGYLSLSANGPAITNDTGNIVARRYYFISQDQPRLADIDAIDDRTSDATAASSRRANFRAHIIQRDRTCVITSERVENCIACHIIPHSKGDDYLANALGPPNPGESQFDTIDDPRNGLLLGDFLHRPFGDGSFAFLKTPTLYLSVDDIPYNPPPQINPTSRITLHYMVDSTIGAVGRLAPNLTDLREPEDTSEWPPTNIVNMSYISAVLNAWAPAPFKQTVREMSRAFYYSTSSDSSDDELGDADPRTPPAQNINRQIRLIARNERKEGQESRGGYQEQTELSSMMDGVVAMWKRSARQRTLASDIHDAPGLNTRVERWLNDPLHPGVFNPDFDGVVPEDEHQSPQIQ